MATSSPQHQPNQFTTDEYVLAYHGPLLYEARVSGRMSTGCFELLLWLRLCSSCLLASDSARGKLE
jgi:hypothetical protein